MWPGHEDGRSREVDISFRSLLIAALSLGFLLAMVLLLLATETALSVWQRLAEAPAWIRGGFFVALGSFAVAFCWLAWRWFKPSPKTADQALQPQITPQSLAQRMSESAQLGVNLSPALEEVREQARRKEAGEVHIALFGEVSAGKSSLVSALVPGAETEADARAGTTTQIRRYHWTAKAGDKVIITDLPGFNLLDDTAAMEECQRAHLVVFVTDGDLTRSQSDELERLQGLGKPVVLALNKLDRFAPAEIADIRARLAEHSGIQSADIVGVTAGGREEIIRLLSDGQEQADSRERATDITALRQRLQFHLDNNRELMESLRDTAVLLLAADKLDRARQEYLGQQADALVKTYSRRAVVGALAAVAPGSDLVIQGVLATRLVQELCALYDVNVRDVQVETFLKLAGGKLRKMSAVTLAIAGNALKAFPGIGTLSGGLLHAVAYGMIFDSLGRAAAHTLATRGALRPIPAAEAFEDLMSENLESRARSLAKLAASHYQGKASS